MNTSPRLKKHGSNQNKGESPHLLTVRGAPSARMISALDSGSSGPGSSPGSGTALCSWARHFTFKRPLFTRVHKWLITGEFTAELLTTFNFTYTYADEQRKLAIEKGSKRKTW